MYRRRICILGGTGFIGRPLVNRLSQQGIEQIIPTRNRQARRHKLILLPGVQLVQADIFNPKQLHSVLAGCDGVINLVGILNEKGHDGSGFKHVYVDLLRLVLDAMRSLGIKRLMQMSALNADSSRASSYYLRSRGEAEELLRTEWEVQSTVFRSSAVFGPEDSFFNRFAALLRLMPVFPLARPSARLAPVYVGDVADAMVAALNRPASFGAIHNLCGPDTKTLMELVRYTADCLSLRRCIVPLPENIAKAQALMCEYLPGKPFSIDNYRSLLMDSVCPEAGKGLLELGVRPTPMAEIVPGYLGGKPRQSFYDQLRRFHQGHGAASSQEDRPSESV